MKVFEMTEKLRTIINFRIPVWVFGVIVPILIAFIGFTVNANARATRTETRQELIEKSNEVRQAQFEKQLEGKVSKDQYEADIKYIRESLGEIKTDLKIHMGAGRK
jgi:uncharacterized membrane protein